jgi:hypothetical protein
MAAARSFPAFLFLAAVSEFVAAPTGVIADAAVVASCQKVSHMRLLLCQCDGWPAHSLSTCFSPELHPVLQGAVIHMHSTPEQCTTAHIT